MTPEVREARAEGLELRVALNNTTGYFGVSHAANGSKFKRYQARVSPGGKQRVQNLGYFATAEEAALSIARWQAAAPEAERAVATVPLTSEEARQQAQAEGLTLRVADRKSKTGYYGVYPSTSCKLKPYEAQVRRNGKLADLGYLATAEEAALCVARSPEGQAAAAAAKAAATVPLTSEEARQQAQAEGLVLRVSENPTGYSGVYHSRPGKPRPYVAQVRLRGKFVYLGVFATAEEAALSVARSGLAAKEAAVAPPLTGDDNVCDETQGEAIVVLDAVEVDVWSDV